MATEARTRPGWGACPPSWPAVWLAVLVLGCSVAPPTAETDSAPTSTLPSGANGTTTKTVPERSQPEHARAPRPDTQPATRSVPPTPSRTGDASGPFGESDVLLGVEAPPSGLQRPLEFGDRPGPLFSPVDNSYRLMDRCERLDLLTAWQSGGLSAVLPYMRYSAWTRRPVEEALADCTWRRYRAVAEGANFGGTEGRHFAHRSRAEEWLRELERETARNRALPRDATEMGFLSNDYGHPERLGGIWFAPWDDPLDEVGVLAGSVAVREGALRGLVRNWSRHLWAYGVTVSAGGRVFEWPLSIQPGEIAPFEIHDWDGPPEAEQIEFDIDAEMSWHADPSRAFSTFGTWEKYLVGEYAQRPMADAVRDRYPQVTADVAPGAVSAGILESGTMRLEVPDSHPSLEDDFENLTVEDLRGYGALFDRDGRIVDVAAATVGRFWYAEGDGESDSWQRQRWEDVPSLPHRDLGLIGVDVRLDVHVPWPDLEALNWQLPRSDYPGMLRAFPEDGDWRWVYIEGGYIFWIGAAHPERDASAQ